MLSQYIYTPIMGLNKKKYFVVYSFKELEFGYLRKVIK